MGLPTEGSNAAKPRAGTVARTDVPTCRLDERLGDVAERVRLAGWDACVAVSEHGVVFGLLRAAELSAEPSQTIRQAMRPGPSTFRPHVDAAEMAEYMAKHDLISSPVTRSDGTLVGLLLRTDLAPYRQPDREQNP